MPPPTLGIFLDHIFFNLIMYQVTFRWSADFTYIDKVTRGHRSMVPLTLRWHDNVSYTHCQWRGILLKIKKKKNYWTSIFPKNRSEPSPSTHGDMSWCWVSYGSHQRSSQDHLKVTARSNKLKTIENSSFLLFLLTLCSLEIYMTA